MSLEWFRRVAGGNPIATLASNVNLPDMDFENLPQYDAIVIGGGSAGFAAARILAATGWKLAVIEGGREVGGLCILRGCMPTKAILHAAELRHAVDQGIEWGMNATRLPVDLNRLRLRKDELIGEFAAYRRQQLESGKFDFIRAHARFIDPYTVALSDGRRLKARHFVIATGSELGPLPLPSLEEVECLTSDRALDLQRLPQSMTVLGGGPVALEFAQFYSRLGVAVSVVQRGDQLLRSSDADVAEELKKALIREGIRIYTGTRILRAYKADGLKILDFEHGGETVRLASEEIFHGLGRVPATANLNLAAAGVELHPSGHIRVNLQQRTSANHIVAAGDCAGPYEIVHIAIQQAEIGAGNLLHPATPAAFDDRLLLSVVFTDPQVAQVGLTEKVCKEQGIPYRVATYPFNDHGKSMILGSQDGLVKLIVARDSGEIIGGACAGPFGGELIHEIMVAMAARMTAAQLAALPHYHPTLAEIWTYPAEELAG